MRQADSINEYMIHPLLLNMDFLPLSYTGPLWYRGENVDKVHSNGHRSLQECDRSTNGPTLVVRRRLDACIDSGHGADRFLDCEQAVLAPVLCFALPFVGDREVCPARSGLFA